MRKEDSLAELFLDLFPSQDHLNHFLRFFPKGTSIIAEMPTHAAMRYSVIATIDELRRRGLIDVEFFERLIEERPAEMDRIKQIQNEWLVDVAKWTESPTSKTKEKGREDAPSVFVSYSRRDENFFQELTTHLQLLQRKRIIDLWHEGRIRAGDDWNQLIQTEIERASIIILLVSPDFLSSDFMWESQGLSQAFERHKRGEVTILPIIVRECHWQDSPIASVQVLPSDGQSLARSRNIDRVWLDVANSVAQAANKWRDVK